MVLFKDLSKSCTDLLTRDFPHEREWEVEFKHRAKNPVFFQTAFLNSQGKVEAASSVKHVGCWGTSETKLGTNVQSAELICKMKGFPNLMFGTKFENFPAISSPSKQSSDVFIEYESKETEQKLNNIPKRNIPRILPHFRFSINPLKRDWCTSATAKVDVCSSAVVTMGFDLSGTTDLRTLRYSVGGGYTKTTKDLIWNASLLGSQLDNRSSGKITSSVHAKSTAPGSAELGAEVSYGVKSGQAEVAFVGMWYLDQPVGGGKTDTTLKLKLTKDAKVAAALSHKFCSSTTAMFGAQLDALKPDTLKYGVKFNISA